MALLPVGGATVAIFNATVYSISEWAAIACTVCGFCGATPLWLQRQMSRHLRNNFLYLSSEASLSLHLLHHSLPWGEHEKMWTWLLRGWTVLIPCLCPTGDRLPLKILQAPKWITSISHQAQDDRSETHSEDSVSSQTVTTWRRRIAEKCPLLWPTLNSRVALLIWEIWQTSERSILKFSPSFLFTAFHGHCIYGEGYVFAIFIRPGYVCSFIRACVTIRWSQKNKDKIV